MRIVVFSHYFPPEINAPATRTYEHCLRWTRSDHDVRVITCRPNCPNGIVYDGYRNRLLPERDVVDGIGVHRVWTYVAPNAGKVRRTLNYLSYLIAAVLMGLFVRRPDVIVATSPQFFCGWAGVLVGLVRRVPVVLEIRDVWPASIEAVEAMRSRPLLRFLGLLEQMMYHLASHIVTVGHGYREHIVRRMSGRHREKVTVITNGVDLSKFRPTKRDEGFLKRHNMDGKFVCSYVGTIGLAHGLDVVLRAASILKSRDRDDICFCLVGDGARRERLETMARHLGVSDWVRFLGIVPKSDVPKVLASSDAMLVHLRTCKLFRSVIPSKIFEIMAMQRPIVMGVAGEAYEIVDEAHAGLPMKPDHETDLVRIIELLADDPALGAELSESGRKYVATHFNRDSLAAEYLRLLHQVAGIPSKDEQRAARSRSGRRASKTKRSNSPAERDVR